MLFCDDRGVYFGAHELLLSRAVPFFVTIVCTEIAGWQGSLKGCGALIVQFIVKCVSVSLVFKWPAGHDISHHAHFIQSVFGTSDTLLSCCLS